MNHFSERLKHARKMNGLSLQELSDKMDNAFSKQDLNRLELGEKLPDSEVLIKLSRALGLTTDYFSKTEVLSLEHVEFRKLVKLPKKEQESVKGRAGDFLERYLELESHLGIKSKAPFKYQNYRIQEKSIAQDIENAASELRNILKIGNDPIYNIHELLEERGIKVVPVTAEYSFSGLSALVEKSIMLMVYNNCVDIPLVRRRFTILHELGHLFLDLSAFEAKQAERICDQFAGAVLLPKDKLLDYLGKHRKSIFINELQYIKQYFGISLPAIMYRAKSLEIISDHYLKYFMIRYNQSYKQHESSGYDGKEVSNRFMQLLIRAVAEDIISTSKAAALNNQKLAEFRRDYLDTIHLNT
jgi:Zn-dependent peptidase ImmA (M78 family)/DNA-binding XRE family transcriptional regulator